MKYPIMRHFSWVFTVCQGICLDVSTIQTFDQGWDLVWIHLIFNILMAILNTIYHNDVSAGSDNAKQYNR